jgi:hypothetical protein
MLSIPEDTLIFPVANTNESASRVLDPRLNIPELDWVQVVITFKLEPKVTFDV